MPKQYIKNDLYTINLEELFNLYSLSKKAREMEMITMQNAIVKAFSEE
ncbi:hypothetical protein [[Clostridium] colinum]|nr:hypothetical protein [[Clostridium] colinum]